jgi:TPR repeat protein
MIPFELELFWDAYDRKDYKTAVCIARPLAEQGNVIHQCNLGSLYLNGMGVLHSYIQAVKWFRLAAEQGHVGSQCNLAYMYRHGFGVPKDIHKAIKWYSKAARTS